MNADERPAARREVIQAEALDWLARHPATPNTSVLTSLPDVSELPELGFDGWRTWFLTAAESVVRWTPEQGVAMFYQSDIRRGGCWIDKGYLILRAAESAGASLLWHKIICRKPPGTITHGRASYSHLLCVSRGTWPAPRHPGPDVLADAGAMNWSKAMGARACELACRFLQEEIGSTVVCDPFCGRGTALAVANAFGLDALGIDRSVRRCRAARTLRLEGDLPDRDAVPHSSPPMAPMESDDG